jgi:hypothetical protein
MLPREEYIEQAYFFRVLRERMQQSASTQELLGSIREEILATTNLPMALEFLEGELKLTGGFATAMQRIGHYFTTFQTFVVQEAEKETGRFDFRTALEVLQKEAEYRAAGGSIQGTFLFQFETLCRNRLGYQRGMEAMSGDPIYDAPWRKWLLTIPRQIGLVDIADLIFVHSRYYRQLHREPQQTALFGEKEGRIALANRRKDPLYLFSALARHLGYPSVPRAVKDEATEHLLFSLRRQIERVETRLRLLEEESRGGINLSQFYVNEKEKKG